MKRHWIPNAVTLVNLLCGCAAIVCILDVRFVTAFWFLFAAGLADFGDGLVARLLNVKSEKGKELDSLADMVSFGVAPGVILYTLFILGPLSELEQAPGIGLVPAALPVFLVTLFSALRLAKFNLDARQSEDFIGLATPSSTLFVSGLMLIYFFDSFGLREFVISPWLLYSVSIVLALLLVSEIPMFSFKFRNLGWRGNELRFIFAAVAILLLIFLQEVAFSLIVIVYVLMNVGSWLAKRGVRSEE